MSGYPGGYQGQPGYQGGYQGQPGYQGGYQGQSGYQGGYQGQPGYQGGPPQGYPGYQGQPQQGYQGGPPPQGYPGGPPPQGYPGDHLHRDIKEDTKVDHMEGLQDTVAHMEDPLANTAHLEIVEGMEVMDMATDMDVVDTESIHMVQDPVQVLKKNSINYHFIDLLNFIL